MAPGPGGPFLERVASRTDLVRFTLQPVGALTLEAPFSEVQEAVREVSESVSAALVADVPGVTRFVDVTVLSAGVRGAAAAGALDDGAATEGVAARSGRGGSGVR